MKDFVSNGSPATPMLFPYQPEQFWQSIRKIIREEVSQLEKLKADDPILETPGMVSKPLFKIAEVCQLFQITKPTIYEWIKHGKLKPVKIRSRVFFLGQDIQALMHSTPSE